MQAGAGLFLAGLFPRGLFLLHDADFTGREDRATKEVRALTSLLISSGRGCALINKLPPPGVRLCRAGRGALGCEMRAGVLNSKP